MKNERITHVQNCRKSAIFERFSTLVKLVSADKTQFTKSATLHSCETLATILKC